MMLWPWTRRRAAHADDVAADARLRDARKLAQHSQKVTANLRREIEKNGWTELLQQAMGGR